MKNFILALMIVLLALFICQGCGTLGEDEGLYNQAICKYRYDRSNDASLFYRVDRDEAAHAVLPDDLYVCYTEKGKTCRGESFPVQMFHRTTQSTAIFSPTDVDNLVCISFDGESCHRNTTFHARKGHVYQVMTDGDRVVSVNDCTTDPKE